jgi:hypothetical protein
MKYIMYQGEAYEQSCEGGTCNAKDGRIIKGFLIKNVNGEVFILTPSLDYGDPDFKNMLQHFYPFKVKPKSVKKMCKIKDINKFAMQEYRRDK